ncbi:condensation domain-containing protein, partial [Rhodococcus sp. ENV425]|uniref:condensation domain-containing protein n=1 Tax=Rhodococcus sp. ENV425 TaxID=2042960 RepID=UPI0035B53738
MRIELGEIEAALLHVPAVAQAVVLVRSDQLVGYVVPAAGAVFDEGAARSAVGQMLPSYMVPSAFVELDALPLNASGKLDRKELPEPVFEVKVFRAATTPVEEIVAGVFAEVLGLDRVGLDDDFFALGGNSLIATQVVSRIGAALDASVPLRLLFENSTVETLAARIDGHDGPARRAPLVPQPRPERVPLSLAQQRMWFLNRFDPDSTANNIPVAVRMSGRLEVPALEEAVCDVLARHESLRTVYPDLDGYGYQKVLAPSEVRVSLEPVRIEPAQLPGELRALAATHFDVSTDVPIVVRLLCLSPEEHVLVAVMHHIAGDGFSMGPLTRDIMVAYAARSLGNEPAWEPL